jgi:hypothetical protein
LESRFFERRFPRALAAGVQPLGHAAAISAPRSVSTGPRFAPLSTP